MESHTQQPTGIPDKLVVAPLETISYEALRDKSTSEATRLFNACCQDGAFYLDMAGTKPGISDAVDGIYELEEHVFGLPEEELMRYDIDVQSPRKLNGYKPKSRNRGGMSDGRDGFQTYAVRKTSFRAP